MKAETFEKLRTAWAEEEIQVQIDGTDPEEADYAELVRTKTEALKAETWPQLVRVMEDACWDLESAMTFLLYALCEDWDMDDTVVLVRANWSS